MCLASFPTVSMHRALKSYGWSVYKMATKPSKKKATKQISSLTFLLGTPCEGSFHKKEGKLLAFVVSPHLSCEKICASPREAPQPPNLAPFCTNCRSLVSGPRVLAGDPVPRNKQIPAWCLTRDTVPFILKGEPNHGAQAAGLIEPKVLWTLYLRA